MIFSFSHDKQIKHIPVLQNPSTRCFGFAEPHNVYRTLSDLINHYHHQSLRMHNRQLDTTLAFPYKFLVQTENEPIYD